MNEILIVDDNSQNRYMLQVLLKSFHFGVTEAINGVDALKKIRNSPPDLIISDILMPEMDGYALCRRLKKDETYQRIPFVFYTSTYSDPQEEKFALNLGADSFVRKPVEPEELEKNLRNLLERKEANLLIGVGQKVLEDEEVSYYKMYNSVLVHRLEEKMLQLEKHKEGLELLIKKHKDYQKIILKERALLRSLIDSIPDLIFFKDKDCSYLGCNKAFEEFANRKETEMIGKTDRELFDPGIKEVFGEMERKVLDTFQPHRIENWSEYPDGRNVLFDTLRTPYFAPDGRLVGMIGISRDITDKYYAEEDLQKAARGLSEAQRIARLGNWEVNLQTKEVNWSEEVYRLFGMNHHEFDGTYDTFQNCVHPGDRRKVREAFVKALKKEVPYDIVHRIVRPKGGVRYVHAKAEFVRSNTGKPIRAFGTVQDITESKVAEMELLKAKARAEESDRLKSAFLANMSHEIRTPLNGIMGFASLLDSPDLSLAKRKQYIHIINTNSSQLLNIVNDIIDFSRIEVGQLQIHESQVNLNAVMVELHSFYREHMQLIGKEHLSLSLHNGLDDKSCGVMADAFRLRQILSNLLNNAIKFTEEGAIEFGYALEPEFLRFFVRDTGIGIPEEKLNIIFDRFTQVEDPTKRRFGGTGLGLAISKELIRLMGGNIWVSQRKEKGTEFFFTVPYKPIDTRS